MAIQTTAGSTFSLSASLPATYDAAGYNALTYTQVGEVTDMGEVGREFNLVNHSPISNRKIQKLKGSYNPGEITLQFAKDYADAGQTLLTAAVASDNNYSIRLVLQSGKKLYFTGLITSNKVSMGGVDQVLAGSCVITLQTDVVEV